jgi:hypothetical protein
VVARLADAARARPWLPVDVDATGEVRRGPAEHPIRSVPVRVVDDAIEADV